MTLVMMVPILSYGTNKKNSDPGLRVLTPLDDQIANIASLMTRNGSFWVISSEIVGCGACPFDDLLPEGACVAQLVRAWV